MPDARKTYRQLSTEEEATVGWFKENAEAFITYASQLSADGIGPREMENAVARMEEALMWAVKGVTG